MSDFGTRLLAIQQARGSDLGLVIAPRLARLPLSIQRYDDPFLPFAKAVIRATRESICLYLFDLAAFMTLGAAGMIALERAIAYAASDTLTVMHGPFVGTAYAEIFNENGWNMDAVTLAYDHDLSAYLTNASKTAFVVRQTYTPPAVQVFRRGGVFWTDAHILEHETPAGMVRVRMVGEDALYISKDDDFAEQIQRHLDSLHS